MRCTTCGADNAGSARFCAQCGTGLRDGAAAAPTSPSGPSRLGLAASGEGDRRIVSAMFADLVDYSRLVTELDPEEVRRRVDVALEAMVEAIERFDGTVEKFIGDAVFAVFGSPRAHDDDAVRAALSALRLRERLTEVSAGPDREPLEVRIGIATGEVVAAPREVGGQRSWALTGEAVATAARLQQLADPGEIVLDEMTARAARGRLDLEPRQAQVLRGRRVATGYYRLRGARPQRLVAPASAGVLIGRSAERRRLREALEAARTSGTGRVVLIVGDAGIGKSRLLADLEEDARAFGFAWTWTESASYETGEPYGYARTFAERIAEEQGTDPGAFARRMLFGDDVPADSARRFGGGVAAIARDAAFSGWEAEARDAPTDPAEVHAALLEVAARFNERLATEFGPRVIIVDDYHWTDRSSVPMIAELIRIAGRLPFVVVVAMRPGPHPDWAVLPHVDVVPLAGLDPPETGRLAATVAGADLTPTDAQLLHERTDGNPLFIGETIRALLEDGGLTVREGRLTLSSDGTGTTVPVSLRALLGARIDALSERSRTALQVASVIGMRFSGALVSELLGVATPAQETFEALAGDALVGPAGEPDAWRFSHPLIHDVAYAGLLSSHRRVLHTRLADHLATREPPTPIGQLAQHRAAAGDVDRAVPLLIAAAEAAIGLGASAEAAGYWRSAADLLGQDPRVEDLRRRAAAAAPD